MKSRIDEIDRTVLHVKTVVDDTSTNSTSIHQGASWMAMFTANEASDARKSKNKCNQLLRTGNHRLINEQHYGTSSLASLFGDIDSLLGAISDKEIDHVNGQSGARPSSAGAALQRVSALQNTTKSMVSHDSLDLSGENLPLVLPPKGLLEATLNFYFDQVNPMLPVFQRHSFCENVQRSYEIPSHQIDEAWILCINNIILQTLNTESLDFFNKPDDTGNVIHGEATETELLKSLAINFRRGLGKLTSLLEPKLVNVQALITMVSRHPQG